MFFHNVSGLLTGGVSLDAIIKCTHYYSWQSCCKPEGDFRPGVYTVIFSSWSFIIFPTSLSIGKVSSSSLNS